VLYEGSNDITIYTNTMSTSNPGAKITQGIENSDGTLAAVGDSVVINTTTGLKTPRVRGVFKLTNDVVKFSRPRTTDTEAPSLTAPADITQGNDPRLASALVATGSPVATDNCTEPVVSSARSDGAAMDAPYPVGVTKVTWTAKDAAGNSTTAVQSITVVDIEAPSLDNPGDFSVNATSPSGAQVTWALHPWDNVGVTSLICTPGSYSAFPIGSNQPVNCTAADAAGNSTSISFLVSVIDAPTQTRNLIQYIIDLHLGEGTTNPLVNQLLAAFDGDGNSCKKMQDFLDLLGKKGGEVPEANMIWMTTEATRIMNVMACPAVSAAKRGRPKAS
jgi:HYR domain-containing protein